MSFQIAIDGPAGAGKSTIAKRVAGKKGFIYVDTGAMYRAMALFLIRKGIDGQDTMLVAAACKEVKISIQYQNGEQIVLLNEENVNDLIRTEEVGNMASVSSSNPHVRAKLLQLQQELARVNNVVMDGRDIGTCILPNAQIKIYLTAESRVRAERRYAELTAKGQQCDLEAIEKDIIKRDEQDMSREHSPLKQADDAILVDTSYMSIEEAADTILKLCKGTGIKNEC